VAVDVRVDDAHLEARPGHRDGEVDGDRRLADTALAGGDRVHPGQRPRLRERDLLLPGTAAQRCREAAALVVAHHTEVDADGGHALDGRHRCGHVPGDLVAQRAAGDGEQDPYGADA